MHRILSDEQRSAVCKRVIKAVRECRKGQSEEEVVNVFAKDKWRGNRPAWDCDASKIKAREEVAMRDDEWGLDEACRAC